MAERFRLAEFDYAHRGLWRMDGPGENSLEAFKAAAQAGFGIEFDVRPAADGIPMIFHDPLLDRLTDGSGLFASYSAHELSAFTLKGGGKIPRLTDLLDIWPGKTPLLCELKIDGETRPAPFSRVVAAHLDRFNGPAAMMSFSPPVITSVPAGMMRGQLISPQIQIGRKNWQAALETLPADKIDYLACHTSDIGEARNWADKYKLPLLIWTVQDQATGLEIASRADAQIFEGWHPRTPRQAASNG